MSEIVKQTKKNEIGYKKPPNPGPGRPKGSKNKFTNIKQAFLNVFDGLGGEDALLDWVNSSKRNKELFYHWITKMLPSNVDVEHSAVEDDDREFQVTVIHVNDGEDKKEKAKKLDEPLYLEKSKTGDSSDFKAPEGARNNTIRIL